MPNPLCSGVVCYRGMLAIQIPGISLAVSITLASAPISSPALAPNSTSHPWLCCVFLRSLPGAGDWDLFGLSGSILSNGHHLFE